MDVFWASWEFIRIFKRNNKKVENEIWGNLRSTDGKHRKHSSLVTRSNLLDHELNTKNKFVFLPRVTLTTWLTTCQWASDSLQFVSSTWEIDANTNYQCDTFVYVCHVSSHCIFDIIWSFLYSMIGQFRYKFDDKFGLRWSEPLRSWLSSVVAPWHATWQAESGTLKWFSNGSASLNKRLVLPCNAKHLAQNMLESTGMCFHDSSRSISLWI